MHIHIYICTSVNREYSFSEFCFSGINDSVHSKRFQATSSTLGKIYNPPCNGLVRPLRGYLINMGENVIRALVPAC